MTDLKRMADERLLKYTVWVKEEDENPGYFTPDMDDIKELLQAMIAEREHANLQAQRVSELATKWRKASERIEELEAVLKSVHAILVGGEQ